MIYIFYWSNNDGFCCKEPMLIENDCKSSSCVTITNAVCIAMMLQFQFVR